MQALISEDWSDREWGEGRRLTPPPTEETHSSSAADNPAVPSRPHDTAPKAASWGVRVLILAASLVILAAFAWAARSFSGRESN